MLHLFTGCFVIECVGGFFLKAATDTTVNNKFLQVVYSLFWILSFEQIAKDYITEQDVWKC